MMPPALSRICRLVRATAIAVLALAAVPVIGFAQTSNAFTACTQGALSNCAVIQLTSQLGIGPGGTNFFEIALRNLGSQTSPTMATTIYNLVFATGQAAATPGTEIDASVAPTRVGGATVVDGAAWDLFDSGDAIFLSALSNNGVGGCVADGPVGGFSQAGSTCGADQFLAFGFFTTRAYDPTAFSLLDLEVVGLTDQLPADSCNDSTPCTITAPPVTATPEPSTIALMITGFSAIAGLGVRRRYRPDASHFAA